MELVVWRFSGHILSVTVNGKKFTGERQSMKQVAKRQAAFCALMFYKALQDTPTDRLEQDTDVARNAHLQQDAQVLQVYTMSSISPTLS